MVETDVGTWGVLSSWQVSETLNGGKNTFDYVIQVGSLDAACNVVQARLQTFG